MVGKLVDSIEEKNLGRSRLQVLLIVDSKYWTIGHFADQVAKDNTTIDAVICSQYAIRQFIKRFGRFPLSFDLVHFLNTKTMEPFSGCLPIVTTLHHMDSSTKIQYLENCDAVMTVSGQWYQYLIELGIPREKVGIVPFAVDIEQFHPVSRDQQSDIRRLLNIAEDAIVIGFAGRRTSDNDGRKGTSCLLEGLKNIRQVYPHLTALIIGPGWQELVRRLQKENIACVHVPYRLDHLEIAKLYRALDVYWITSRVEGGPVPLLEAMASGIPCISTPVGAVLDVVEHEKNGFIVPFDQPQDFVRISQELISDRALMRRIGEAARATIVRERSWNQTKACLTILYEMALKNFQMNQQRNETNRSDMEKKNYRKESETPCLGSAAISFHELGSKTKEWIKACEYVRGSRMLIQLGEWRCALQLVGSALKIDPFDFNVWVQISSVLFREGRKKIWSNLNESMLL